MLDFLAASADPTTDLFQITTSFNSVHGIIQLSMAPAFLLAGIGALMNVMMARLTWVAGRIERLEEKLSDACDKRVHQELARLVRRRRLAQHAMKFSTASALTICIVIASLFITALIEAQLGGFIAITWIAAMVCLIAGLILFLAETIVAAAGQSTRQN